MTGYNKIILMGNLTRDPETKTLPDSQTTVCNFALAVNQTWKDGGGNVREEVLFMDCVSFGRTAETLGAHLRKGRPIHVEGRLKMESWYQDGQVRSKVPVIVERFQFVDSGRSQTHNGPIEVDPGEVDSQSPMTVLGLLPKVLADPGTRRRQRAPSSPPIADSAAVEPSR